MRNKLLTAWWVTGGLLMSSASMFAHHNQASFNGQVLTTVVGTVKEFNWMNPHSMLILQVKDDKGEVAEWAIELAPPNSLSRDNNWTDTTFKPGDHVTVDGHAYKDGRKIMRAVRMVMPDGKEFKGRF
jgi:hypothetical protein